MLNSIETIFAAGRAAQARFDYTTANVIFSYLLSNHAVDRFGLQVGIKYLEATPLEEDKGEGSPKGLQFNDITNECISEEYYHSLVCIFFGDMGKNSLCIPAPKLSDTALLHAFKFAPSEGGFVPREMPKWNEDKTATPAAEGEYNMSNIGELLGAFVVPEWIFHEGHYPSPPSPPSLKVGNRY